MACVRVETFYRFCGHISVVIEHTSACNKQREELWVEEGRPVANWCWNPLPQKVKLVYNVGHFCYKHDIHPLIQDLQGPRENHKQDEQTLSGDELIQRLGFDPVNQHIEVTARRWRTMVLEYEKTNTTRSQTRSLETLQQELEMMDPARQARQREFEDGANRFVHDGEPRGCLILMLSKAYEPNTLLQAVNPNDITADDQCTICHQRLDGPMDIDSPDPHGADQPRRINCQGGHRFHAGCIVRWFIAQVGARLKDCPLCREPFKVVFQHSYGPPVYNWVRVGEQVPHGIVSHLRRCQVGGYIPFSLVDAGMNQFEQVNFVPFGTVDRWGDID